MPPGRYLGQLNKADDRFVAGCDLDQFSGVRLGKHKIFIGSFVQLTKEKLKTGEGLEVFGKPDFGHVYRIMRTINEGPRILVLWYFYLTDQFHNVPFKSDPLEFPAITNRDVVCDARSTPIYGQISRDSIKSVSSMVRINYRDDPLQLMKQTNTKLCCRFTLRMAEGQTVLEPYSKPTNLNRSIFTNEKLASTLGSQELLQTAPESAKTHNELPVKLQRCSVILKRLEATSHADPGAAKIKQEKSANHRRVVTTAFAYQPTIRLPGAPIGSTLTLTVTAPNQVSSQDETSPNNTLQQEETSEEIYQHCIKNLRRNIWGSPSPEKKTVVGGPDGTPKLFRQEPLGTTSTHNNNEKVIGREEHIAQILGFLTQKMRDKSTGCLLLCGNTGTGKTASLTYVIKTLQNMKENKELDFKLIQVAEIDPKKPQHIFSLMAESLLHTKLTPARAQASLASLFATDDMKRPPTIIAVDTLDVLFPKKQDIIYSMLNWSSHSSSKLIILGISNVVDLPERLMTGKPTADISRIVFRPYTAEQLQKIVQVRLGETGDFDRDVQIYVVSKVAARSGDAFKAIEICTRAMALAKEEKSKTVQMPHAMTALKEMLESPIVEAIKNLGPLEKLFLECLVGEVEKTGSNVTTPRTVLQAMQVAGLPQGVSSAKILEICGQLASSHIVLAGRDKLGMNQLISLAVSKEHTNSAFLIK